MSRNRAILALLLGLGLATQVYAEDRYTVTELGKLWASDVKATSINGAGQVIGTLEGGVFPVKVHAFLSAEGTVQDLHDTVLKSAPCKTLVHTTGWYITDSGEVIGWVFCTGHEIVAGIADNWFIYRNGVTVVLPGTVGASSKPGEYPVTIHDMVHIFKMQQDGTIRDSGLLSGPGMASGIPGYAMGMNAAGQAVGWVEESGARVAHAWVWKDGSLSWLKSTGPASKALGLNAAGDVVGAAEVSEHVRHAFLYRGGSMQDLGTLGGDESVAHGINTLGQVVGWSAAEPPAAGKPQARSRAFLYEEGHMKDLTRHLTGPTAQYVTLEEATGINDAGLIVANGRDSRSGGERAYLLTPVPRTP